jgi:glutathione synthase/RimK-type ligase-like ATP-grasp enzyme
MKLYPYNMGSAGAKALAQALGIKRIRHQGKMVETGWLLNWGASAFKRPIAAYGVLNKTGAVQKASNKLETFKALQGKVGIPEWTESREEAMKWREKGVDVVVRHKLTGHSGEGIEIVPHDNLAHILPEAPLYVKYIPKTDEFRIHVFQGDAFFVQRKARKKEVPDEKVNWKIRNHQNGFIYAHQDVVVSEIARGEAVAAVAALGLDFGAVDMIYNKKQDKYYVLEVNTAPGLQGETLDRYVQKFKEFQ